MCELNM